MNELDYLITELKREPCYTTKAYCIAFRDIVSRFYMFKGVSISIKNTANRSVVSIRGSKYILDEISLIFSTFKTEVLDKKLNKEFISRVNLFRQPKRTDLYIAGHVDTGNIASDFKLFFIQEDVSTASYLQANMPTSISLDLTPKAWYNTLSLCKTASNPLLSKLNVQGTWLVAILTSQQAIFQLKDIITVESNRQKYINKQPVDCVCFPEMNCIRYYFFYISDDFKLNNYCNILIGGK